MVRSSVPYPSVMTPEKMTRRNFLTASAKAGAGLVLGAAVLNACARVSVAPELPVVGLPPFALPPLPYPPDALAPHLDAQTMAIHHGKHHAGYVAKLTAALASYPGYQRKSLEDLLAGTAQMPPPLAEVVRNHGGGHYNHSLFWQCLSPRPSSPSAALKQALDHRFGSREAFQNAFEAAALSVFGSGWAWLVRNADGQLHIATTSNQDSPLLASAEQPGKPLLGVDVWEHAYYLNYQNRRADYLKAFWQVVNWEFVSRRFSSGPDVAGGR